RAREGSRTAGGELSGILATVRCGRAVKSMFCRGAESVVVWTICSTMQGQRMKYSMVDVVGLGLLMASAFADEKTAPKASPNDKAASKAGAEFKDLKSKVSYGLGVNIGRTLKKQWAQLDADLLARGFRDAMGDKAELTDAQIQEALMAYQEELTANRDKGQTEFLTTNKAKPGVKELASGLQYK